MKQRVQDHLVSQDWSSFTQQEHDLWRKLCRRQAKILPDRAVPEFLDGVKRLNIVEDRIPRFEDISEILRKETGWEMVAVPGLVPDDIFFSLLAERRFPSTNFLRTPEQIDYLQEPDIFHDTYGHIPLLVHPTFADYMEAYGRVGLAALEQGNLHHLSRLYWFTVEFGLIQTEQGLRIYGSGIVSSPKESVFCLESQKPNRIAFERKRLMRTDYRIDDLQDTYFVIQSFDDLILPPAEEFMLMFQELDGLPDHAVAEVLTGEIQIPPNLPRESLLA